MLGVAINRLDRQMGKLLREINRQMKIAAREAAKQEREQERRRAAAVREAERARKAEERAAERLRKAQAAEQTRLVKAAAAEQKRLEKEAKQAHIASMEAEAEKRNAELAEKYDDLENLLNATLDVDDFVDLDSLRRDVEHPDFNRADLEEPLTPPPTISDDAKPVFVSPPPPSGIGKLFGKRKHERALRDAQSSHEAELAAWDAQNVQNQAAREAAAAKHAADERERLDELKREQERFQRECAERESEVDAHNTALEKLKADLAYGASEAVEEYIDIVLSNSVYPEWFSIAHRFSFQPTTAELDLTVLLPPPTALPTAKAYKYQKSSDEIVETSLSNKACKDRYLSIVEQVALRSLHEVFEADRRGLIKSISLSVGTETVNPATGLDGLIPFAAVAAERDSFMEIDLSRVVPSATLAHLGAAVSKNPFELVPADTSGVRRA